MGLRSFVVIANCQARRISAAIEAMTRVTFQSLGTIITHLSKDVEESGPCCDCQLSYLEGLAN
jgi:hypothetical protein